MGNFSFFYIRRKKKRTSLNIDKKIHCCTLTSTIEGIRNVHSFEFFNRYRLSTIYRGIFMYNVSFFFNIIILSTSLLELLISCWYFIVYTFFSSIYKCERNMGYSQKPNLLGTQELKIKTNRYKISPAFFESRCLYLFLRLEFSSR